MYMCVLEVAENNANSFVVPLRGLLTCLAPAAAHQVSYITSPACTKQQRITWLFLVFRKVKKSLYCISCKISKYIAEKL